MKIGNSSSARKSKRVNIERAKTSPASEFERPADVIESRDLSDKEKKRVLNQWEVDAQGLCRASDEGMTGGEPSRLSEVQKARREMSTDGNAGSSGRKDRRTSGKRQP
jgi:hypothetical protein